MISRLEKIMKTPIRKISVWFRKLLYNKKFTIPLAVIVAIGFWLVITVQENPVRERTLSGISVSIATEDTVIEELGLDIVSGGYGQTVDVVVKGPSYIVNSLTTADVLVQPVLLQVSAPGTYDLELSAIRNSSVSGYSIVKVNPAKITVNFDYVETKTFTVTASAEGVAAEAGLVAEAAVVADSESKMISIKGVRSDIEKIASVVAKASVNTVIGQTTSYDADIVLYDADGNVLDDTKYTLSADKVKIAVPISRRKTVKLIPTFENEPEGFKATPISYTLDQQEITIIGPKETVDNLEVIGLSPIDFREITETTTSFDTTIQLPDGIKLVDSKDTVNVNISLRGYDDKLVRVSQFIYNNPDNVVVEGAAIQNVRIYAPKSVLKKISEKNLYAEVDVSGKQSGEYTINVTVKCDEYDTVWQVGEYTAAITIY